MYLHVYMYLLLHVVHITFNYMLSFLQLLRAGKLSSAFGIQQGIAMVFTIWDSSDRPVPWSWAEFTKAETLVV